MCHPQKQVCTQGSLHCFLLIHLSVCPLFHNFFMGLLQQLVHVFLGMLFVIFHLLCFLGLDLPGFLGGSNYLLPWDITIQTERDKWPTVGETSSKKAKQKKSSRGKGLVKTLSCLSLQKKHFIRCGDNVVSVRTDGTKKYSLYSFIKQLYLLWKSLASIKTV